MNQNNIIAMQNRIQKAAAAGVWQSAVNNGYSPQQAVQIVNHYMSPNGMLQKKASAWNDVLNRTYNAIVSVTRGQ